MNHSVVTTSSGFWIFFSAAKFGLSILGRQNDVKRCCGYFLCFFLCFFFKCCEKNASNE